VGNDGEGRKIEPPQCMVYDEGAILAEGSFRDMQQHGSLRGTIRMLNEIVRADSERRSYILSANMDGKNAPDVLLE